MILRLPPTKCLPTFSLGKLHLLLLNESIKHYMGFPGGSVVKNLPVMWETWVQSLGWEDPLEEGMATHLSVLAWRNSWTEERGGLQSMGLQTVGHS